MMLNVNSDVNLAAPETTSRFLSPINVAYNFIPINLEKFKLRSATKATQEEIDLTR